MVKILKASPLQLLEYYMKEMSRNEIKRRSIVFILLVLTYLVYEIEIRNNNNDHVKFEQYSKVKSKAMQFFFISMMGKLNHLGG